MNLIHLFSTAVKALNSNKVRSALTMLGVVIGVFAVVSLVSLGKGIENYITDEFEKLGSNLLFVSPGSGDFTGDPATTYTRNKLDEKHIDLIEEHAKDYILSVFPMYISAENLEYKAKQYMGEIIGLNHIGFSDFGYEIESGRAFSKTEEKAKARVILIGSEVKKELFRAQDPVSQKVKMGRKSYEIIGVFKSRGANYDDGVLLPYTTMRTNFDLDKFSSIIVRAKSSDVADIALRKVELALLRDLEEEEFEVLSSSDILGSAQEILGVITIALGAVAGISLLVGGVGIMNIMLVSVTERIREIGLRKAVGATPRVIAAQFLVESTLLSVIGGVIGLLLGFALTQAVQPFLRAEMTLQAVGMAFLFSLFVGVLFGTYPALNAAKKDVIEALRHE